jgi:H+-transporting ATPase
MAEPINEKVPVTEEAPTKVSGTTPTDPEKTAGEPPKRVREYKEMEHTTEGPAKALVDMNTIQFTAEDIYDKDKVDIEHVSMEDVFKLLQCDENGITDDEAVRRVGIFGPNKVRPLGVPSNTPTPCAAR